MTFSSARRADDFLKLRPMKSPLSSHPERNSIRLQLKRNPLLAGLDDSALTEFAGLLTIQEGLRGERLLDQGSRDLKQFFVLDGVLKRTVTSAEGREMTLRFVDEDGMETCYEAWRQRTGSAFAIVCAKRARVASLPMADWQGFLERHPAAREAFHDLLVQVSAAIVEHTIALLQLDAPSRVHQFSFKHPELVDRLPQKDLASHLNLSAETLCRLSRRGRPALQAA
jgi:CRP-like cAMP-binding protein